MKTKILAVMFTDIAGYTQRTSSQTYEENAQLLKQHKEIVHPLIQRLGGSVVKEMGDGVLAVFSSPTRAVEAAMAVQDRLAELNREREPEQQLHLRIAINVGEVRLERNDVFGEGVNVAARLEAETPVDEVYVSGATYLTMNRTGIPMGFLGQRKLKGITEPVTVFALPRFSGVDVQEQYNDLLPYGGRQLQKLARQRRRRNLKVAAMAAMVAVALAAAGTFAAQNMQRQARVSDLIVAVERNDWHGVVGKVKNMRADGIKVEDEMANLYGRLRLADPARACRALDVLDEIINSPQSRDLASRLRLQHSFQLLSTGELAQAEACLGQVALASSTPEGRVRILSEIHLEALEAVRSRAVDDLFVALREYEEFLRVGSAPQEHLQLIAEVVAQAYRYNRTRPVADSLVVEFLAGTAAPALALCAVDGTTPGTARNWLVARLESIELDEPLDWASIYAAQLADRSCTARRNAIEQIQRQGRLSAVGLLMREVAKRDVCTLSTARLAVNELVQSGATDRLHFQSDRPAFPQASQISTLIATR